MCRDLGVNYIENKVFKIICKREVNLCGFLIKYHTSKENKEKDTENYYLEKLNSLYPQDSNIVYSTILASCEDYLINIQSDSSDEVNEKNSVKDYIFSYAEKEVTFLNHALDDLCPSIRMLSYFFSYLDSLLEQSIHSINYLDGLINLKSLKKKDDSMKLISLLKNTCKIGFLNDILFNTFKKHNEDLFEKEHDSEDWEKIKPNYKYFLVESYYNIQKKLDKVFEMIILANSSVDKSLCRKENSLKLIKSGFYMAYFFLFKEKAKVNFEKYLLKPNFNVSRQVWDLMDTKGIRTFSKIGYPTISKRNSYLLNLNYFEYSIDDLEKMLISFVNQEKEDKEEKESINNSVLRERNVEKEQHDSESEMKYSEVSSAFKSEKSSGEERDKEKSKTNTNDLKPSNSTIPSNQTNPTTINSGTPKLKMSNRNRLFFKEENNNKSGPGKVVNKSLNLKFLSSSKGYEHVPSEFFGNQCSEKCCCSDNKLSLTSSDPGNLIIHIHGGGFISMSSSSHENYTRKWSNVLKCPIISVDYSLAPENPYPVALNELYYTYLWIIDSSKIKIKKLILAGDSAGGNLAAALISMLIINKKKLPDLLLLSYPALHLSINTMSPCMLLSLDDVVISHSLLQASLDSYLAGLSGDEHFLASPGLIQSEVLKYFPKTRIYLGSTDPLRDQSFRFLLRLV